MAETKPTTYTREYVKEQVDWILDFILEEKDVVYLGEVFENLPYSRQRFSEWGTIFDKDEEITDTIAKIKDILETRVNVGGLRNKLNPAMTKFNLINNYQWKEKTETDVTSGGEKIAPIPIYDLRNHGNKEDSETQ